MKKRILGYILAIGISIIIIELKLSFVSILGSDTPFLLASLAIILSSLYGGYESGLVSLVATGILVTYFFLTPSDSFTISKHSLLQLMTFFSEGLFLIWVVVRVKRSQLREHHLRERLEVTLASIGDGVIAADTTSKITFMNEIAENLTGWQFRRARGKNINEVCVIIDEKTKAPIDNPFVETLKEGKVTSLSQQAVLKNYFGLEIPIDNTIAPIWSKKNKLLGTVLVFRDITERKNLEEQRDLLLGVASHELKNNIAGIKGFAQILERSLEKENSRHLDNAKKITVKIEFLTRIINNLMDVTKLKVGMLDIKREEFDINTLLKDVVTEQQLTSKNHLLIMQGKIQEKVYGDRMRISQVLTNLISNAVKYSPKKQEIIISLSNKNDKALISVQDFGIGIPKGKQSKLFEPFYRAVEGENKQSISGSGLGLYIANEIVKHNGGSMWLESEEKKGTTFYFSIPLAKSYTEIEKDQDTHMNRIKIWFNKLWE